MHGECVWMFILIDTCESKRIMKNILIAAVLGVQTRDNSKLNVSCLVLFDLKKIKIRFYIIFFKSKLIV